MATSLTAKVGLSVSASYSNPIDVGTPIYEPSYTPTWAFTDGTGADQAKAIWSDTRTLTASATENLDLAGGLTDVFGNTITFTKIKAISVAAASGNTNNVVVGGAGSNTFLLFSDATDKLPILPGGGFFYVAPNATGVPVTAGTGDILLVANSAGSTSVTYTITILGVV